MYRVTPLRTDGVYCRESAGTGPVALKVVLVTSAAPVGHHGPINARLSFPTRDLIDSGVTRWRMAVSIYGRRRGKREDPWVSTRLGLSVENKRTDAGQDHLTNFAGPNSPARTGTGITSRSGNYSQLIHTLLKVLNIHERLDKPPQR